MSYDPTLNIGTHTPICSVEPVDTLLKTSPKTQLSRYMQEWSLFDIRWHCIPSTRPRNCRHVFLNDPLSPACHVACLLLNVKALTKRLNCTEIYFNCTCFERAPDSVGYSVGTEPLLYKMSQVRAPFYSTLFISTIYFVLREFALLFYLLFLRTGQQSKETGKIRVKLLAILNTYVSTACFSSPFDML